MARTDDSLESGMATVKEPAIKGVLLFALGNDGIDYLTLAKWSRDRIHRYLDLPVAVVTDQHCSSSEFDRVITVSTDEDGTKRWFDDLGRTTDWHNRDRCTAYDLTPWNHTLLLDVDYVVNSDFLTTVMSTEQDFLCYRTSVAIGGDLLQHTFGDHRFPMWWATVIAFRKSHQAQWIFESMQMIRDHWRHYRDLYAIKDTMFRNDIALSIALGIVSGHTLKVDSIPGCLLATTPAHQLTAHTPERWEISWPKPDQRLGRCVLEGVDFHAMGKANLLKAVDVGI
jgi:hypothetical protein